MGSIALGVMGLGSLLSAGVGAGTSVAAANTQASAANNAANLQFELGQEGLNFQEQQYNQTQQNLAPWMDVGKGSILALQSMLNNGTTFAPWSQTFTPPSAQQAAATPGYQFTLQQGENAINNSAAASGGLESTGTAKNLAQYASGLADTTYQQTYNNAFQNYLQNYNQYNNNQTNLFNRFAATAGIGQQAANTIGSLGAQTGAQVGSTLLGTGAQVGQQYNNIGAAQASGYVGAGNAASGALGNLGQYAFLNSLLNPGGGGSTAITYNPINTTNNLSAFSPYGTPTVPQQSYDNTPPSFDPYNPIFPSFPVAGPAQP